MSTTYELCVWQFISNCYAPIATGFATREEAVEEMRRERARRDAERRYTDLGTFEIRPTVA
ncbi:hypothetical protein G6L68_25035 [Agrobacterium fabrum]|uniref:hypothetical protein n=1 Tax=Agrobacterium fabrum TaxID=1176649 RepID=UPI000F0C7548|nr:hypothetical protein [Agrobacterium fabrum]AYM66151.1 hypothetical protein At12D13_49990 [Agrobacterium fabrum]NTE63898.1 hypothetical protein [Agrobacterium fabrum]